MLFINHSPCFFLASPLALNLLLNSTTHSFLGYTHLPTSRSLPEIPWRLLCLALAKSVIMYLGDLTDLRNNPSSVLAHFSGLFSRKLAFSPLSARPPLLVQCTLTEAISAASPYSVSSIPCSDHHLFFSTSFLVSCPNKLWTPLPAGPETTYSLWTLVDLQCRLLATWPPFPYYQSSIPWQWFNYILEIIFNSLVPFLLENNILVKPQCWLKLNFPSTLCQ